MTDMRKIIDFLEIAFAFLSVALGVLGFFIVLICALLLIWDFEVLFYLKTAASFLIFSAIFFLLFKLIEIINN